jgi:hypothetical membrane protein
MSLQSLKKFDFSNWNHLAVLISAFGPIQFIFITILAMFFFPGGYSFFDNFFSTLGLTETGTGTPNPISSVLFNLALLLGTISLVPLWILMWMNFKEKTSEKIIATIGSYLGLLSAPLLTLIGVFPADTELKAHILVTLLFFIFTAFAILFYSIVILLNKEYSYYYALAGFAITIFIIFFTTGFFKDFPALAQKLAVYSMIIWALIQINGLWYQMIGEN